MLFLFALIIGVSSGLRTFTAPAVLCWTVRLHRFGLGASPFTFMDSGAAVVILTLLGLGEYIFDLLPNVPNRTSPPALIARIVSGSFCGACLFTAVAESWILGALLGAIGAVIGAFAGFHARRNLVQKLKVKDALIAIPEDLLAIGLAYLAVAL